MLEKDSYQYELEASTIDEATELVGNHNRYLNYLEEKSDATLFHRGNRIVIESADDNEAQLILNVLSALQVLIKRGIPLSIADVVTALKMARKGSLAQFTTLYEEALLNDAHGRTIRVKTLGQKEYVSAIQHNDVVFGIGPAGTGKTFMAVCMAVKALKQGQVKRIIITRPAVEAGESLGFLPGDLKEKVDPYLRPIYDALYTVFGKEHTERLLDRDVIEIAPLAYMRGRTLDDAFVILDEAQNTTAAQMKMFLTRLGYHSKMVINGDKTQIDLPRGAKSGLLDAETKLKHLNRISFVQFSEYDVVRHPVVAEIIRAYEVEGDV